MFFRALLHTLDTHYLSTIRADRRAIFYGRHVADFLLTDFALLAVYVYNVADLA